MKYSKIAYSFTFCLLSLGLAKGVHAQQSGLVNVDLNNVNVEIAKDINVNVSQIPVTVQAPIGVAANVCDVAVNVLATDLRDGSATCNATSTSKALNQIVQRQIGTQR